MTPPSTDTAAPILRRGFLWLGAATTVGIVAELAAERHWSAGSQWVAWLAVAVAITALALVAWSRSPRQLQIGRVLAVAVMLGALFGVWEHIESNHEAGELDQVYSARWEALPAAERWWLALTKTVGPSPPLAPGALAQVAVCALLATVGHPARSAHGRQPRAPIST